MPAGESARAKATQLRTKAEQLHAWASSWESGALGEERVAAALSNADQQNIRVLHDRLQNASGSKANIDHLVVTAAGVFLIDAKNWKGVVTAEAGSLRQRWDSENGPQSAVKYGELQEVRRVAAQVEAGIGRPVTPVLCLANDQADAFGPPRELDGVHVVPVSALVSWLEQQPPLKRPVSIGTVAVELSCKFPPAGVDGVLRADEWTVAGTRQAARAPRGAGRQARPRSKRRRKPAQSRSPQMWRLAVGLLMLIAVATLGPKIAGSIGNGIVQGATRVLTPTAAHTAPPDPPLSAAQARRLDDWRIRAGLYAAHDEPSGLAYVADASLSYEGPACRIQLEQLAPFRRGLLRAPDHQLASTARRFDRATHDLLHACIANKPVALHHAEGAMTVAASEINARYNRLVGIDPSAYNATRVL